MFSFFSVAFVGGGAHADPSKVVDEGKVDPGKQSETPTETPNADLKIPTSKAYVDGVVATKQNKLGATSNGANNTPNYVYNATTNPTAAGSVVTTTDSAGITGQRGIATAPVPDGNGGYSNGDWLPTMSALMNQISSATDTLTWDTAETASTNAYETHFGTGTNYWPAADETKLVNTAALANGLSLKQNILPQQTQPSTGGFGLSDATDTSPRGGQTIALTDTAGVVEKRYITAGGGFPLTNVSSPGSMLSYIRGTYDAATMATSNFGINNATNRGFITGSLVSSELLRDTYSALNNEKQNKLNGATGAIVTYGATDGTTGALTLDTSSLYTSDNQHVPSSKLVSDQLNTRVAQSALLNTTETDTAISSASGAPSWATGTSELYRVPGAVSVNNWAYNLMGEWQTNEKVPTMDTLANALAGLYDDISTSLENIDVNTSNNSQTATSIANAQIQKPAYVSGNGNYFSSTEDLFWLPDFSGASSLLGGYAQNKKIPTMDTLAYALNGLFKTRQSTTDWKTVADIDVALWEIGSDEGEYTSFVNSDYLDNFVPTLRALMDESVSLYSFVEDNKQNILSGTEGAIVVYGESEGEVGEIDVATTVTDDSWSVPTTAAVYSAVNARQNIIPAAGKYRTTSSATSDTTISDWTSASVRGTALVSKTDRSGVVGERKIFEANSIYNNTAATNIQIATIGAVKEQTNAKKVCHQYKPGATQNNANCWLWTIQNNVTTNMPTGLDIEIGGGDDSGGGGTIERPPINGKTL